jgi:hypothetical protein
VVKGQHPRGLLRRRQQRPQPGGLLKVGHDRLFHHDAGNAAG